jgi:hypothetical protein
MALAQSSQQMRRAILERFREGHGDKWVAEMHKKALQIILNKKSPAAASNWRKALRGFIDHYPSLDNGRISLPRQVEAIMFCARTLRFIRVITQSHWRFFIFEGKMKSGRRPIQKAKTPKDSADQFREWQELRIKVSEAELTAAQNKTASVETKVKGNGHTARKPSGRSRPH